MPNLDKLECNLPEFGTAATQAGDTITLTLRGVADTDAKEQLDDVLAALHDQATGGEVDRVSVDIAEVEFMNSTCLKAFLTWLRKLRDAPAYRVELRSSPTVYWQRRSMEALASFAPEQVTHVEQS